MSPLVHTWYFEFCFKGILNVPVLTKELDEDWLRIAPLTLMYDDIVPPQHQNETSRKIRDFYFGNQSISTETRDQLSDLYSDRFFVYPTEKAARLYSKHGGPTYLYLFTYAGEYTNVEETPGNPNHIGTVFHIIFHSQSQIH